MQAAFLIHEGFIFNLPSQTGSGCICGEDRHEKNKTSLLEERTEKSWNKLSISPLCLPQRIPQVLVAADAIWCSYGVLESHCSQSTLTWHLEILVFKAIWTLSSWLFLIFGAVRRGARVVINFSPIREKKINSTSNKSFAWKVTKHFPSAQQWRHRARATTVPAASNGLEGACPRFLGAPFMQSTLVWAPLLVNSMQLVVKALLSSTRTRTPGISAGLCHHCLDKEGAQPSTMEEFSDMLEPIIFKGFIHFPEVLSPSTKKTSSAPFTTLKRAVKHELCQLRAKWCHPWKAGREFTRAQSS